jgi:excinuclease UvrABC nuclease subunit
VLRLNAGLEFQPENDTEFFALLPEHPAVCLIEPREESAQPHLIRTANLRRRLQRLLGPGDPTSKRLNLREFARQVRYRVTNSAFEQALTYYQLARQYFPKRYQSMMRLRPAPVLKVNLNNAYPRCYVTRHISVNEHGEPAGGIYYGPFPSRKGAQAYADSVLDFFKVRRCQIKIRRDPSFPGCMYSEMKMCLAPCFAGCTKQEYDAEVGRLVEVLETSGGSLRARYEQERGRASEELDFEHAAAVHKKLEKLDDALRAGPEIARRVQDLNAVILQRMAEEQTVGLFGVRAGRLAEPFALQFGDTSRPRSAEETIRDYLESVMSAGPALGTPKQMATDLGEHLRLVSRWFYSNPRQGEIFFRERDWPFRRILRACARLLAPPKEEAGETKQ